MDCTNTRIPYQQIGYFSRIIIDYLNGSPHLQSFYAHPVSLEGIREAIEARKKFPTDRQLLVDVLRQDYAEVQTTEAVQANIQELLSENTFTIVTAHQPNIFTGYLYFIYKILHIIKLADVLKSKFPGYKFVPVFYMGSEDADLEELGKIYLNGEKLTWETTQMGAVGRMNPKGLERIIERMEGELSVHPFGNELMRMVRDFYLNSPDIQTATFRLVNALFAEYGLITLLPDNARLKRTMMNVFEDDLLNQTPSAIVEKTIQQLSDHYKVQANPREINLFYLENDTRDRIVKNGDEWKVVGQNIRFSASTLKQQLREHPERFSPNVILRGLFQETVLPNIAFIGGGGETAYWLELKELFLHYKVPFPILVLRNSFLFIEKKWKDKIDKLGFGTEEIFKEERQLVETIVKRDSKIQLNLDNEVETVTNLYSGLKDIAGKADPSLNQHVDALRTRAVKQVRQLEKKMLRAEKRRFEDQQRQIHSVKESLFPHNSLQERIENFMPFYARYGADFIRMIYENSPTLEQEFVVLTQQ